MADDKCVLYSYFRSSCSWRVRIALNLKGVEYDYRAVNLLKAEQKDAEYVNNQNPQALIPTLVHNGNTLNQSLSICEYLDEVYPDQGPALVPRTDPAKRALVRRLALTIAADIQPVQNLRVLLYVKGLSDDQGKMDYGKWVIENGFVALEKALQSCAGKYCVGDEVTLPDLALVPQVFNARRFKVDMAQFPTISRIEAELVQLAAFAAASPDQQPDCPEDLRATGGK